MTTAKKILLVHGYNGNPEYVWFPWLRKILEEKGFEVIVPQLPAPTLPSLDEWIKTITEIISKFDENDIVITHSGGGRATIRAIINQKKKIKHLLMFAPVLTFEYFTPKFIERSEKKSEESKEALDNWVTMNTYKEAPIDLSLVNPFVRTQAIFSKDDPICESSASKLLPKEWHIEHWDDCKHFWSKEEPKLLEFILKTL